jgi:hypothetical protein
MHLQHIEDYGPGWYLSWNQTPRKGTKGEGTPSALDHPSRLGFQRREALRKGAGWETEARREEAQKDDEKTHSEARESVKTTNRRSTNGLHADARGGFQSMTKRKPPVKLSPREIIPGKQYPGIHGKVVDWTDHAFEEGILYIRVRFTDKTELSWRIVTSTVIEEADLSDWKTGNFRQLKVFVQNESNGEWLMHRNVARAYNALWAEHKRVRVAWMKILAQGDRALERRLLRADLEDSKHHDEVLRYEERLSRPQRRRVLRLNRYGTKIESVMAALLKL